MSDARFSPAEKWGQIKGPAPIIGSVSLKLSTETDDHFRKVVERWKYLDIKKKYWTISCYYYSQIKRSKKWKKWQSIAHGFIVCCLFDSIRLIEKANLFTDLSYSVPNVFFVCLFVRLVFCSGYLLMLN